jgi:hypothetical protein
MYWGAWATASVAETTAIDRTKKTMLGESISVRCLYIFAAGHYLVNGE